MLRRREGLASAFLAVPPGPWRRLPLALHLKLWDRSRSALGLSPLVVVGDGLDADEQAAGQTVCHNDARISEAWYDEHHLRKQLMGAGGRQFVRVRF